ncbi:uncharacterized protein LOC122402525 isoform X2 [Colletes gigas]|uniref:uncharacterized protein LOC122402525 isoform X2 n=1 Tax=Colletes gigas TaxID=935657 RepID=UPI001C9AAE95|nr:uncharacterized protein LOC122402525 isoform X2 [Colletes gigas]
MFFIATIYTQSYRPFISMRCRSKLPRNREQENSSAPANVELNEAKERKASIVSCRLNVGSARAKSRQTGRAEPSRRRETFGLRGAWVNKRWYETASCNATRDCKRCPDGDAAESQRDNRFANRLSSPVALSRSPLLENREKCQSERPRCDKIFKLVYSDWSIRSMATKIKMEHVRSYIDPQIGNPSKNTTNLIEWNVDMNVTISNVKKSKLFQRSRGIVLFFLVIIFAVTLSHLRKEVRALQAQMQSVNVNLLVLMSKYDRLNRSFNRAWSQRSDKIHQHRNMHDVKRLLDGSTSISKVVEIFDDVRNANNRSTYTYNPVAPYLNSNKNSKDKYLSRDDVHGTNNENDIPITKPLTDVDDYDDNFDKDETNLRIERAVLTIEKQNTTSTQINTNRDVDVSHDNDDDDDYNDHELDIWKEPRTGRARRDERRGPLVATFVGAIPEQHVTDTVYIGPWVKSTKNDTQFSLTKFHLVEDKKSIEVTATGLYMISAQIFYFGEPTNYSYWILLSSEGKSRTQKLVKCSTSSSTTATEVSCYTSVITQLQRGDRVHIQQQEKDRLINMREGHSYVQLVLLSNNIRKKRLR